MPMMTLPSMSDRLADNLDRAFPRLVADHQDRIFSGVRRMLPTHADAEDVAQETFVRAYRALQRYERERIANLKVQPWLWTIAINLCRNAARGRSRRPRLVALAQASDQDAGNRTDDDAIEMLPDAAWQRRLEVLPARTRTAVILRHVVGLPYADIAAAQERLVGTVKADVHRGLARLRVILMAETEVSR